MGKTVNIEGGKQRKHHTFIPLDADDREFAANHLDSECSRNSKYI